VDSRSDGTVSIGGANVFPGNIETAILEHDTLRKHVEHFYISVAEDNRLNARLVVQLMIRDYSQTTLKWQEEFKETALQAILATLIRDNQEYRVTWKNNHLVTPVIQLIAPDDEYDASIKRHYVKDELTLEEAL
jgi:phenylacetate-coenzyme A ligase PaaK-like adenylate-forming protein